MIAQGCAKLDPGTTILRSNDSVALSAFRLFIWGPEGAHYDSPGLSEARPWDDNPPRTRPVGAHETHLVPHILFVIRDVIFFKQSPILILKRFFKMMFPLVGDIAQNCLFMTGAY
jgi:hypothetical protein